MTACAGPPQDSAFNTGAVDWMIHEPGPWSGTSTTAPTGPNCPVRDPVGCPTSAPEAFQGAVATVGLEDGATNFGVTIVVDVGEVAGGVTTDVERTVVGVVERLERTVVERA